MRRAASLLLVLLAAASSASAQSSRGALGIDAMFAPTSGLGFACYVTDGLSIRPWLGLGYSSYQGFFANVGGQVRYEFGSGWTVSPYLSASAQYSHSDAAAIAEPARRAAGETQVVTQGNGAQFGTGAGLRLRASSDLALFAEARVIYATYPIGELRRGWSTFDISDRARGEVVLGLSYLFH